MSPKGIQGPTPERLALAARARELYQQGQHLTQSQIAERLGISRSYASALIDDPDGSKARARKDRYAGTCIDCQGATSGSDGPAQTPERCEACRRTYAQTELRFWTRERVIDSLLRWTAMHGRPPSADDWRPSDSFFPFPNGSQCYGRGDIGQREGWGTWNDFLSAGGLPVWKAGEHGSTPRRAVAA